MKILYLQIFPFWGSGSGTYARHLASEVGKKHKVAVAAPDDRQIEKAKLYTLNMPFKVAFTGHPEWQDCILYTKLDDNQINTLEASLREQIFRIVDDFKPDIIHVHHAFPLAWIAKEIKIARNINYIITIHGSELPTLEKDRRYLQKTLEAMSRAKKIIPNSGWTKEWFLRIFDGQFRDKCRVIPGGVDVAKFTYNDRDAKSVGVQLGVYDNPVVLFAGKLTKYKGVEYLISAAKKIHGEIIILGDGPDRIRLEEKVKKLSLTNVHFLGHLGAGVKKLVPYYSRADVFVAPSVWDEPLGLVILESMACQTPVVVTRKGGIPIAVKDGYNGYFVRPRNSSEIVQKVNLLLDNPEMRYKMGRQARVSIEKKFSWGNIAGRFERIYEKYLTPNSGVSAKLK